MYELALAISEGYGAPDQSIVVVPHPFQTMPPEVIRAKADAAFADILEACTSWKPSKTEVPPPKPAYPAETFKFKGAVDDVTALYYRNGWSDGFPIVPPTPERVKWMLEGTSAKPDEVLGLAPPRMGKITTELAAVYAVMAGAKPQYLPVIIATIDALLDPAHYWAAATATTNPNALLIVVNGPILDELGIQYGVGALAPGPLSEPNATIGRAVNLIMDVVGGSQPTSADRSALGNPGSYTMVLGEREESNPWELISEQQGFSRGTNTVTVFEVRSEVNMQLKAAGNPTDLLYCMSKCILGVSGYGESLFTCDLTSRVLLILCPQHADFLGREGWSLRDIQEYLHENVRIPMSDYLIKWANVPPACRADESMPAIAQGPETYMVMVAGGAGPHSQYVDTNRYTPVTRAIDKWR